MRAKKKNIFLISTTFVLVIFCVFLVAKDSRAFGFTGPIAPHPTLINQIDNAGALINTDKVRNIFLDGVSNPSTRLTITGSDSSADNFGFVVSNSSGEQLLRIRNDGVAGFGPVDLKNPTSGFTPSNPEDTYPIQIDDLQIFSPYLLFLGTSTYADTSATATDMYVVNWNTTGSISGAEGVGLSTITNFAAITNISSFNTTLNASSVSPGVFGSSTAGGNFFFAPNYSIGVNTSSNSNLPANFSIYGSANFVSDLNAGLSPTPGPARVNVSSTNAWGASWQKAIRINNVLDTTGMELYNSGAVEFGGGTGGTLYGITQSNTNTTHPELNPGLYFFSASSSEFSHDDFLVNTKFTVTPNLILFGESDSPQTNAALSIKGNYSQTGDSLIIKRHSAAPLSSIQASTFGGSRGPDLVLNSTSTGTITGNLYLNNFTDGNIILNPNSSNNVGINTASPGAKLDIAGKLKTQSLKITNGSPDTNKILIATNSAGDTTWQPSILPLGSLGNTLYYNGTSWAVPLNFLNNDPSLGIGVASLWDLYGLNALHVAGGVSIGSYAGVNASPSNGLIVSGNVIAGVLSGYPDPLAKLDLMGNTVILRGNGGSVKLFVEHGSSPGKNMCDDQTGGICLVGFWNGSRHNGACVWNVGVVDVVCAAFND